MGSGGRKNQLLISMKDRIPVGTVPVCVGGTVRPAVDSSTSKNPMLICMAVCSLLVIVAVSSALKRVGL
jgi:hypothetical protein